MTLQQDIKNKKTIMMIEPHPDDEIFIPGTFIKAKESGCTSYVVCIKTPLAFPPVRRFKRIKAISWFEHKYLEKYFILHHNKINWFTSIKIKRQLTRIIENIKPDVILTFTPYGWWNHPEHIATSKMVTSVCNRLKYLPHLYWFVNTDQSIPPHKCFEYIKFRPTEKFPINWAKKKEVWKHYAPSVKALDVLLKDKTRLEANDGLEYFRVVK